MPKLSQEKKDKISEQILNYLFTISPEPKFTSEIAKETARDEEFTKSILQDLSKKSLIVEVKKNKNGVNYLKRQRWRLSNQAFEVYKRHQPSQTATFSSQLQQSL
jgi:predicted transcriptional regulator with HTH domain